MLQSFIRSAATAASLGVAAAGAAWAEPAEDENDVLIKEIRELCLDRRGKVDDLAKRALRRKKDRAMEMPPLSIEDMPYMREVGLDLAGGTLVNYAAKSRSAPASRCRFVSYSNNMAALADRLRSQFNLPEPVLRPIDNFRQTTARTPLDGGLATVTLEYGLQDNQRAGAFTLTISR